MQARELLPPEMFIGWSVETAADVMRSASMPVDYLGVSPVFATPTKTDTKAPWGLDGLRQVRALTALPLVAIGGIHSGNAGDVLRAGADGLAVVSAICAADDPGAAARELRPDRLVRVVGRRSGVAGFGASARGRQITKPAEGGLVTRAVAAGQSNTGDSTPSTLCSLGLVVVYCRWIFFSGKISGAAAKAASAHS